MRSPGPAAASLMRRYTSEADGTLQPVLPRPIIQTAERPRKSLSPTQEYLKLVYIVNAHICFPSAAYQ